MKVPWSFFLVAASAMFFEVVSAQIPCLPKGGTCFGDQTCCKGRCISPGGRSTPVCDA
ncbi:uncharacterized protein CIMG_12874 [Coccidioides immitis RS]|uniref:Uncharacterized protein n=1 Tax=Coccidioides immitis (strain RS) TaxID=246410 RepID=A0A0D8JVL2_COCIM|nr:uncharacterized protein CIMG_12874 [Coccidioides immitis RS]KJF60318.1 hypothetical protein CIMG_12874 [Coccidioides immitis RS]